MKAQENSVQARMEKKNAAKYFTRNLRSNFFTANSDSELELSDRDSVSEEIVQDDKSSSDSDSLNQRQRNPMQQMRILRHKKF